MVEHFWSFRVGDVISAIILIATIFAIYFGPIRAVEVARKNDEHREAARRRRKIFAAMMRTRRIYVHPDHVWALNTIQLEFAHHPEVLRAHRAYIENLYEAAPGAGPALVTFLERRNDRFFELLHEVAKAVGCAIDKRDLERTAYMPEGWANDEDEMRFFRRSMIELLHGRRPLVVAPFQPPTASPYPPPPSNVVQAPR